jgi:hypothetical protein
MRKKGYERHIEPAGKNCCPLDNNNDFTLGVESQRSHLADFAAFRDRSCGGSRAYCSNSSGLPALLGISTFQEGQSSLEDALRVAGRAQDDQGHRYSHQRRIKSPAIAEATKRLVESHDDLRNCSSFHELWSFTTSLLTPVEGIGELYIYDTALRIGAHLGLTPEKVYVHAGTRIGATRLGLLSRRDGHKPWLNSGELPALLRDLRSSDVENLLCIYKSRLQSDRAEGG